MGTFELELQQLLYEVYTSIAFSHVSRYVIKRTMIITIYISTTTFFTLTSKMRGVVFIFLDTLHMYILK